jgi:hypothetical protein
MKLKMKQIVIAPFSTKEGITSYSTLALGVDGYVYRYDPQCQGWIQWSMKKVDCRLNHPGKR